MKVQDLHKELIPYGFRLDLGDILDIKLISNIYRYNSRIPLEVFYRTTELTNNVRSAAQRASLWGQRGNNNRERKSYFGPFIYSQERQDRRRVAQQEQQERRARIAEGQGTVPKKRATIHYTVPSGDSKYSCSMKECDEVPPETEQALENHEPRSNAGEEKTNSGGEDKGEEEDQAPPSPLENTVYNRAAKEKEEWDKMIQDELSRIRKETDEKRGKVQDQEDPSQSRKIEQTRNRKLQSSPGTEGTPEFFACESGATVKGYTTQPTQKHPAAKNSPPKHQSQTPDQGTPLEETNAPLGKNPLYPITNQPHQPPHPQNRPAVKNNPRSRAPKKQLPQRHPCQSNDPLNPGGRWQWDWTDQAKYGSPLYYEPHSHAVAAELVSPDANAPIDPNLPPRQEEEEEGELERPVKVVFKDRASFDKAREAARNGSSMARQKPTKPGKRRGRT